MERCVSGGPALRQGDLNVEGRAAVGEYPDGEATDDGAGRTRTEVRGVAGDIYVERPADRMKVEEKCGLLPVQYRRVRNVRGTDGIIRDRKVELEGMRLAGTV